MNYYINKLSLKCRCCNNYHYEEPRYRDVFMQFAFDDICEWSDFTDEVPSLDERIWERSSRCPEANEERIIKVNSPFNFRIGNKFKLVFRPALSSMNGWNSHPDEISKSSIVTCSLKKVIISDDYYAWIKVKVHKSLLIEEIPDIIEPKRFDSAIISTYLIYGGNYCASNKDYIFMSSDAQSDIGAWVLIKVIEDKYHVILLGDWSFYHDYTYVDNYIISKEEIDEFMGTSQLVDM